MENEENRLNTIIDEFRNGRKATQSDLQWIIEKAKEVIFQEPNVLELDVPITIVGDIHGHFKDLIEVFRISSNPPESQYLFLGDYVDRGDASIRVLGLLLSLKLKYKDKIWLLRGNHESPGVDRYGLKSEVLQEYQNLELYSSFTSLFEGLPLCAVIHNSIFCVHGGISRKAMSLSSLKDLNRFEESDIITDLLWADPNLDRSAGDFSPSRRRISWEFGETVTNKFLAENNLSLIVRGHEVFDHGNRYCHSDRVLTLSSFCMPTAGGSTEGSVLVLDENMERHIVEFRPKHRFDFDCELLQNFIY